jgi:hypothetical protein
VINDPNYQIGGEEKKDKVPKLGRGCSARKIEILPKAAFDGRSEVAQTLVH